MDTISFSSSSTASGGPETGTATADYHHDMHQDEHNEVNEERKQPCGPVLAPQRKLWSTPDEVAQEALKLLKLDSTDHFMDIGCGSGRLLLLAAKNFHCQCRGYEIHETRAAEARQLIKDSNIHDSTVQIYTMDGLNADLSWATALYLYLIPRGLKRVLRLIQEVKENKSENTDFRGPTRVATLLYPFPRDVIKPSEVKWIKTPVQTKEEQLFKWPIYLYEFSDK